MFFIFTRACKKYGFTYTLNAINGLTISLHPNNALGFIELKQEYYENSYFTLFLKAIKKMKEYKKGSENS